jgi:hypothetical protein
MDDSVSDSKRATITYSYTKFGIYWASYLPFAVELLNHFLGDMHNIVRELTVATRRDTDEYKNRWNTCTTLFG